MRNDGAADEDEQRRPLPAGPRPRRERRGLLRVPPARVDDGSAQEDADERGRQETPLPVLRCRGLRPDQPHERAPLVNVLILFETAREPQFHYPCAMKFPSLLPSPSLALAAAPLLRRRSEMGERLPSAAGRREHPREQPAPLGRAAPRRLRRATRRTRSGSSSRSSASGASTRRSRRSTSSSRRRRSACSSSSSRRASARRSRSRRSRAIPTSSQTRPAAPDLQRLLDRRRRDGAARLRQLRRARRLRAAGAARRRRARERS